MPKGVYSREGQRVFGRAVRPWTEDELADLRESYGREPARAIAERQGRTPKAIYVKAERLELTGREPCGSRT